jgi:hypothetical protein
MVPWHHPDEFWHWLSIGFPLGFHWVSIGFTLGFHWVSIGFPWFFLAPQNGNFHRDHSMTHGDLSGLRGFEQRKPHDFMGQYTGTLLGLHLDERHHFPL